jgi:hypothetical protein
MKPGRYFDGKCDVCACRITSRPGGYVGRVELYDSSDRMTRRRHYCWGCACRVRGALYAAGARFLSREVTLGDGGRRAARFPVRCVGMPPVQ